MSAYRPVLVGLGCGFILGMIACWSSPALIFQRLGMGAVMLGGASALIWFACVVLDQGLRAFRLHKLFIQFMWARARQKDADE